MITHKAWYDYIYLFFTVRVLYIRPGTSIFTYFSVCVITHKAWYEYICTEFIRVRDCTHKAASTTKLTVSLILRDCRRHNDTGRLLVRCECIDLFLGV